MNDDLLARLSEPDVDLRGMAAALRARAVQSEIVAHALDTLAAVRKAQNFRIEVWERGQLVEIAAEARNIDVAQAAFNALIPERPKSFLMLMQGARIVRKWPEERR